MANEITQEVKEVLQLLKDRRNVLISGAPGTGKSRLLGEVANAFITSSIATESAPVPVHIPGASVPIPSAIPADTNPGLQSIFPAPSRTNRKIFRTTFHQNSKYREFITGMVPIIGAGGGFRIMSGTLYRSSEHAKLADGASLLVIDEINRGPAVQVFGGSIVSIEPDKRLLEDNSNHPQTQYFEIIDPESSEIIEYALPEHLYILAAMNQADTSVEPLDVAFLRRWAPYNLEPNTDFLRNYFSLSETKIEPLPDTPTEIAHVYEAAIQSWEVVNSRIRLGRGAEFQLGHGIYLANNQTPPEVIQEALVFSAEVWGYIRMHIDEVFFGDLRGIAAVLNVIGGPQDHPYKLNETTFADEPRVDLIGPKKVDAENIYGLLRAIVG